MEESVINCYIKAGKIAREVIEFARSFIKKDMLLVEIAEAVEGKIIELGGGLAFPINLSINEIAAHYTPSLNDGTRASGLLKIDFGVEIDGYLADCAFSLDLTDDSCFREIIKTNENALKNALDIIMPGIRIGKIGEAIQETVDNSGFSIIKNLSGHSLGRDIVHAPPTISNYKNSNPKELRNIAIAIEPFLTKGTGRVYESSNSEIYMLEKLGSVRDSDARKLLRFIADTYKTKPFCKRWLEKQDFKKLSFSLNMLVNQKMLHNFPVLIESSKKPVSQAEHTVLILDDRVIVTTIDSAKQGE